MALAGMLSFKLIIVAYAGWITNIPAITTGPLLLAAVIYTIRRPGIATTAMLASAGAVFLLSGQQQFLYYAILLAISYAMLDAAAAARRGQWQRLGRNALCLAVGGVLAVGIAAPLLLSHFADRSLVTRSYADYAFFLADHHFHPQHLLTFLYPEWLGTPINGTYPGSELWEDVGYFGLIPLALSLIGLVIAWRRPLTWWLAGSIAVCLFLTADTPINRFPLTGCPAMRRFASRIGSCFPFRSWALPWRGLAWRNCWPVGNLGIRRVGWSIRRLPG